MVMPNFLIIGAQKAGTTSLYHYLNQHPQIYMSSIKEPHFFTLEGEDYDFNGPNGKLQLNPEFITTLDAYQRLFEGVTHETAIGEASPSYLYSSKAPERIQHHIPDVKLIVILRNPIDRAYSSFLHCIRGGYEPLRDFEQALQQEEERIRNNWGRRWHYKAHGFYGVQLKRYFERFDRNQIQVYLYEDLCNNSTGLVQDIFKFLQLDETVTPNISTKHNVSEMKGNKFFYTLQQGLSPFKNIIKPLIPEQLRGSFRKQALIKPPFPPKLRQELIELYREDILHLQNLINRDLSQWLS